MKLLLEIIILLLLPLILLSCSIHASSNNIGDLETLSATANNIDSDPWIVTFGEVSSHPVDIKSSITVDNSGNIYVTGSFTGNMDFDPGPGIEERKEGGTYLCRFTNSGSLDWVLIWEFVSPRDLFIEIDNDDNIYLAGGFYFTIDVDPGPDVDERVSNGGSDVFLFKILPVGTLDWALTWGGENNAYLPHGDLNMAIEITSSGNIALCGVYDENMLLPGDEDPLVLTGTNHTPFLVIFNPDGKLISGLSFEGISYVYDLAFDSDGNSYILGSFNGDYDFDPGPGTFIEQLDHNHSNGYLCKLSPSGEFIWVKLLDSSWRSSLAVNEQDHIYVCYYYYYAPDPDGGIYNYHEAVLEVIDTEGDTLWIKSMGLKAYIYDIEFDNTGNPIICGAITTRGFGSTQREDIEDIGFITKYSATGDRIWEYEFDNTSMSIVYNITTDQMNNVFISGYYDGSLIFPEEIGLSSVDAAGKPELFFAKIGQLVP